MKKSSERIQFIADYISSYEEKIRLLNSNGLFDAAKLFELFAIEVGGLYLNQRLSNLNFIEHDYPCVDLISEDEQTFIQVSTVKNIPPKIKKTLEDIKKSERNDISNIKNIKFFMLYNDSVGNVKDYTGDDQIGNVPFTKANDLITTNDILKKATANTDFQIKLYELLKKETESTKDNLYKFEEAIEKSIKVGLSNIDSKINNEYEIDRSGLISKIKADNYKNITIQGGAGCGKSVLCKMLVEEEQTVIYARAERFIEETDINNIWGFNIRQILEYSNEKPIIFLIDSLEFIADIRTKFDLLCELYECSMNFPTVKVITSCRTSDKPPFIKIESKYKVRSYEVPELTITEQIAISKKYNIIKNMMLINSYTELLKSPFYINLIISKISDMENILDENQLREYIWQHVICLDDSDTKKIVESITFNRAKDFSVGVTNAEYDTKIVKRLVSQGVVIRNGNTIRLKYDIFEDICFEQYLDNEFDKCKGKYNEFFSKIETLGRCIYRRYQIWTSNKLLAKDNREKFLFRLIFSDTMPNDWRQQTEIGLVKSRYCCQFFYEYGQTIIENNMLTNFIKITNLYAFEINNDFSRNSTYIQLRPIGQGRKSLINLVAQNRLYEENIIARRDIVKLCTDYSKVQLTEKKTAEKACYILSCLINQYIEECEPRYYYKTMNSLLVPVYEMAEYSKNWIKRFWVKLENYYKGGNEAFIRLAEGIIEDTIGYKHRKLAEQLPKELCKLAEMFWTYSPEIDRQPNIYQTDKHDISQYYGLSKKASDYEMESSWKTAKGSNFFFALFNSDFWAGLNWAIEFVNNAVSYMAENNKGSLMKYEINFLETNATKSYLGLMEMWQVTTQEYMMPIIISDLLFCLRETLYNIIENDSIANGNTTIFAKNVRNLIYNKSNNIALLTIIADIGMEFCQKLPGYSLDLATCIDIIYIDQTGSSLLTKNPQLELLKEQALLTIGFPSKLLERYSKKTNKQYDLLNYVRQCQLFYGEDIKARSHKILDYLYSKIPNDKENATKYLQIQKMDLRTAQPVKIDDNTLALVPNVTGEAKRVTIENEKQTQPYINIAELINACNEKISKGEFMLDDCLEAIDVLLETRKSCTVPSIYDKHHVDLIVMALNDRTLDAATRSEICQVWIDGIRSYFTMGSFIFEYSHSIELFSQIEMGVSEEVKNQIKRLILDLILFKEGHGIIVGIAQYARKYLTINTPLSKAVFNTIIKLAEDEMNHQKFNAHYIMKYRQKEKLVFSPNLQPKLKGVDYYIQEDKREKYKSQKDEIIMTYLYNNGTLDFSDFDTDDFDIAILCYAINCGLTLDDDSFAAIVRKSLTTMINIWKINENGHNAHKILDVYSLFQVVSFFQREIVENRTFTVLDILFTNVNFSKFTKDTVQFYLDVFGELLPRYFNSHSDRDERKYYQNIILQLESKILEIDEEKVKVELYKSLILSVTTYRALEDWSKYQSSYSYPDKQFLNCLFKKYGRFHLKDMLHTINKLHIKDLLPEILSAVRYVFKDANEFNADEFYKIIEEERNIVLILITKSFLDFSDCIKKDDELTRSFEEVLEMLVQINYEEAATLLDEFRVH